MLQYQKFISKAFLLISFFISSFNAAAQSVSSGTIEGHLIDEKKVPLSFTTVALKSALDSSIIAGVSCDNGGRFVFKNIKKGSYLIIAQMLGYETFKQKISLNDANPSINIGIVSMLPSAKLLNTVTVTAQKPLIERRADKIIINLNTAITAGASVMDVMDRLPGVQVNPNDQISLNGRGVQVYIDGKATPLTAEALSSLLKGMSSANIQKIELIAHPSSKYDAASSGGIINIVRKRNSNEGLNGNVYGGFGQGQYGKNNGGLNLNYKTEKYNLFFNTDYLFNKYFVNNDLVTDFLTPGQSGLAKNVSVVNSERRTRNYTPNFGVDFYLSPKTTLSFSATDGLQIFNKNANSSTQSLNSSEALLNESNFLNLVKTTSNNFSSGMHLSHQIDTAGKEYTVDVDYYRYTNNTDQNNEDLIYNPNGQLISDAPTLFDQNRSFNIYSAKADYTRPLKGKGQLEAGWKSSYVLSNNSNQLFDVVGTALIPNISQNDFFKYAENINAVYINYSKDYKKLSYQLGLRAENTWGKGEQTQTGETFNKNYFQLFPSAFFNYKLNTGNALMLSLDRKIDRPTYENLNPLIRIINSTTYVQGNPDLQPATSYNGSATYAYKNALFFTFDYSINYHDFTYFTSPLSTNGITTTKPDNNRYTQYFNLIIAYNKQVTPWWYTSTNINVGKRSYQSTENNTSLSSSGLLAFNMDSYDSFSITKKFSFLTLFRYRGKSVDRNITNDPYFTLTSGVRQTLLNNRASIALNVTDIFHTYKSRYLQTSALINQYWNNHYETTAVRLNFTYSFGGKIKKPKSSNGATDEKRRTDIKEN